MRRRSKSAALATVFLLVIGFAYSDDFVEFVLDLAGVPFAPSGPWLVFALDVLLVLGSAVLKSWLGGGVDLRRLLTGRWGAGAALVVVAHLVLIATAGQRDQLNDPARIWVSLAVTAVFIVAIGLLLDGAVGEGPGSRIWLAPLLIGTFVAQLASVLWYPVIDVPNGCASEVSPDYFTTACQIIPVLLLALGFELNYLHQSGRVRDPGEWAAPVLTVVLLCVAEVLAFSMVVKAGLGQRCGLAAVWHEYISLVLTTQAMAIGLASVAWLLISGRGNDA